jgi:glycosyltransferase involved in cell wall biosynthesis
MKITLVGPGIMPIPPIGWGAVEILIWDIKNALEKLDHKVQIVNTRNFNEIINDINKFRPDFVHIHYDEFIGLYPYIQYPKAITSHFGYLERPQLFNGYVNIFNAFGDIKPNIFCLSESILRVYQVMLNISTDNLFLNPNGVNSEVFNFTEFPEYSEKSIYLAKIDYRKRQYLFQSIDSLWFVGNIEDSRFNPRKNYLGEWNKKTLYRSLTEYGNLVLLSDGEAHPLVCMEALACGLGVVVSEFGAANLDTSKDFIDVIPEKKIKDLEYIESIIVKNRKYSVNHRNEIREYSKQFSWDSIIKKYYLPNIKKVIGVYNDRV